MQRGIFAPTRDVMIGGWRDLYRSNGRFWQWCAVVRRKSASLRLVSMRSDTVLPQ
jgi:hypothetical protein